MTTTSIFVTIAADFFPACIHTHTPPFVGLQYLEGYENKPISIKKAIVWVQNMVRMVPFPWKSVSGQTGPSQVGTWSQAPSLVSLFSSPLPTQSPQFFFSSPYSSCKGPALFWRLRAFSCLIPKEPMDLNAAQRD